jgi:hypothetical protein
MKRFTFLLAVAALSVGCTSRIPSGFNPLVSGSGSTGGADTLDIRSANQRRDALAAAILAGNIPPEAILTTVYFEFDKYTVSASERAKIDAIAGRVKATDIIIAGYTDHFGTAEYNLGLSDRRAQSVRDYLVKLGSNQSRSEIMASALSMPTRTPLVVSPAPRTERRSSSTSTIPALFPPLQLLSRRFVRPPLVTPPLRSPLSEHS